jgi:mutator family transposase
MVRRGVERVHAVGLGYGKDWLQPTCVHDVEPAWRSDCPRRLAHEELHRRIEVAYWAALDEAGSVTDGEARLRCLVGELERDCPSAAACLAEDLPALCAHLEYRLRLCKRLRSTNLLERSLEEVKQRTKVTGRFPGETSCLSLCWAVLNLIIARARGFGLTPTTSTARCPPPTDAHRYS